MAKANETTSTRLLKSYLDRERPSPVRHARRDASSYYDYAGTQVIDPSSVKPGVITRMLWAIERWREAHAEAKAASEAKKALDRLNSK